ncbi:MAG: acyl-CoA synthetase [Microthrixaceae bacterium]
MPVHEAGEHLAARARLTPDKPAVVMVPGGEVRTFGDLEDTSVRLARLLRERGLRTGDHLAVLVDNEPAFFDAVWAAMRTGLYVTPINWHLTAAEAGYIVGDCDATALVVSARLAPVVEAMAPADLARVTTRLCVGGEVPGFEPMEDLLAGTDPGEVPEEHDGGWMFYSSGTTGRPKGILPPISPEPLGAPSFLGRMLTGLFGFDADAVYLSPAPLYHAAPAGWTVGTQRLGGTAVVMEHFDPLELLAAVEAHRVTHVQLVPTHMIRLLEVPAVERGRFDLGSLRYVIHAAAPCPVEVKRRFIDWVGPIVHEFYSGSEGAGFCYIGPDEWLAHPGSVGRSMTGAIHVLDDGGNELPIGEEGEVWFETNRPFEYHKDPGKTRSVWNDRGWSWMGDVGRVDAEGYLYLTDRASHMIISGGVNIYPRESEDVLIGHPAVADVGVLGVPDPEMGERVCAFVQLAPDSELSADDAGAAELLAWCRDRLSHYKCPREVRFVDELPRLPTGKLLKRLLVV